MKAAVRRNVGVPVCVGIAATKTLAKLANKWAKNNPALRRGLPLGVRWPAGAGSCSWAGCPVIGNLGRGGPADQSG